ncbi:MAG: hypothetical protein WKF90_10135 [Pyrinomonadaceae bacterium]
MARSSSSLVRALAFLKSVFNFDHICSIGEKSGQYGGSQMTLARQLLAISSIGLVEGWGMRVLPDVSVFTRQNLELRLLSS